MAALQLGHEFPILFLRNYSQLALWESPALFRKRQVFEREKSRSALVNGPYTYRNFEAGVVKGWNQVRLKMTSDSCWNGNFQPTEGGVATGNPARVVYDGNGEPMARGLNRAEIRAATSASIKESVLQEVIDQCPSVLPIREFFPATSAAYSLGREIPVELGAQPGERLGYIDNLLVTDDGHLVLVETKLWRNPEAVREVIAQVLEYAMALGDLGLEALERAIRRGEARTRRLASEESVADYVRRCAGERGGPPLMDDFEDEFAKYRQIGELLVLIVSDGVRTSVERLTRWFSDQFAPGSPLRLGLVELRFFDDDGGQVAVPVTLLRTKELGRHTVVVEVKETAATNVSISRRESEVGRDSRTKEVRRPDTSMTKESFLTAIRSALSEDQLASVEQVIEGLDRLGLWTRGTPTTWQYGVRDATSFLGFVALADRYIWCQIPVRLRAILGGDGFVRCKRALNSVANFYRPDEVDDPEKVNALTPKYDALVGREGEFINAVGEVADMAKRALNEQR